MVEPSADPRPGRYGAAGFFAASCNVFVGTVVAWSAVPYYLLFVYFTPIVLVDLIVSGVLAVQSGRTGQVGRGMLIGLWSVPLTSVVIWSSFLLTW